MSRPCIMPHVTEHCSANFCCKHVGTGLLLVAKGTVTLWQPAIACPLQGSTALHQAAIAGHVAVVETLLLSGADSEARNTSVSRNSLYRSESLPYIPTVTMSYMLNVCSRRLVIRVWQQT